MPENKLHEPEYDVIVAGAGPNGLMLACELALGGIRPVVLDPLPGPSDEPKANGLVGQVVRLLDMRGLYPGFAAELACLGFPVEPGTPEPAARYIFAGMALELAKVADNPLYGLPVPQPVLVQLLADRARALGADIRWGHGLGDFSESDEAVTATITRSGGGGYRATARILVAADGGRSPVRKKLGIGFSGITAGNHIGRLGHAEIPAELRTPDGGLEIPGAGYFHFGHNRIESGGMFVFAELIPGERAANKPDRRAAAGRIPRMATGDQSATCRRCGRFGGPATNSRTGIGAYAALSDGVCTDRGHQQRGRTDHGRPAYW